MLRRVELHRAHFELRCPVRTARGTHRARPVVFVRLVTETGEGWGECAALQGGTSVDAPFDDVLEGFCELGVERFLAAVRSGGGWLPPASAVPRLFGADACDRAMAATFEMAVLDAEARAEDEPLWRRLGVEEDRARAGSEVGHLVGIPEDRLLGTLVERVAKVADLGMRVRLKIEPGWDVEPVRAVREGFPRLSLQVDANGSYRIGGEGPERAERLCGLDPAGLVCIEQPLPPADLGALAALAGRLATPVCLDESLTSLRRLREAIRCGACEVACIKPSRFGGLLGAKEAASLCKEAGIPAFVGGLFETGFARSANAALAATDGFDLPGDLSEPSGYLTSDVCAYGPLLTKAVRPFAGPGVAPMPSLGRATRRWTVEPD